MDIQILYEDACLAVAVKPPRILSEDSADAPGMPTLLAGGGVPLYTVHRLDKGTGGVVVYAKDKKTAALLSAQMQEKKHFYKEYLAVCEGALPEREGRLTDLLFHSRSGNKTFVVDRMRKGVKEATLTYRTLADGDGCSLLHILLETGRTHQIRIQLASRGCPLLGDARYGARKKEAFPALYAFRLAFLHPKTGEKMECVYFPEEGAFSAYDFSQWF